MTVSKPCSAPSSRERSRQPRSTRRAGAARGADGSRGPESGAEDPRQCPVRFARSRQVISALRPAATMEGHRDRGREVFVKACATCHKAEGRGIDVGPNLATVTSRTPDDLLTHIVDPNREVAPNFVNYNVATEEGRVYSGIIAEESAGALVLLRAEGARDVIPREQIERVASTGVSLMPEGLEKGLTLQDLADLIAFVRSIGAPAKAGAP